MLQLSPVMTWNRVNIVSSMVPNIALQSEKCSKDEH